MKLPTTLAGYKKLFLFPHKSEQPTPARDWHVLMASAGLLLLGSVSWNVWFFLGVVSDRGITVPAEEERPPDTAAIQEAKEAFQSRFLERERYAGEYVFIDPSR